MDDLILKAAQFAKRAHAGQLRKYNRRPYIVHPARVAARTMLLDDVTPDEVAAAWLHDVIEDCNYTAEDLLAEGFSQFAVSLVVELTNPSKQRQDLSRAGRKQLDHDHVLHVSREAKRIKLLDRIDNLLDLTGADDSFRSLYVAESVQLAECLRDVDDELLEELFNTIGSLGFARDHRDPRTDS